MSLPAAAVPATAHQPVRQCCGPAPKPSRLGPIRHPGLTSTTPLASTAPTTDRYWRTILPLSKPALASLMV
jgi:hypothetical protein